MASMHDSVRFKTTVYAAIELSKKSWVVAIARPDRDRLLSGKQDEKSTSIKMRECRRMRDKGRA